MKKIIVFAIVICFVFTCVDGYADHTKALWGMRFEEVQKVMGKSELISETDKWSYAKYQNQKISKFNADLTLWFNDGCLYKKWFRIETTKNNDAGYNYLSQALSKKYGAPTISGKIERTELTKYYDVVIELWDHGLEDQGAEKIKSFLDFWFYNDESETDLVMWDTKDEYIIVAYTNILPIKYLIDVCYIDKVNFEGLNLSGL